MKRLYLTLALSLAFAGVVGMLASHTLALGQANHKTNIPKTMSSHRDEVKQVPPTVFSIKATSKPMVTKTQFSLPDGSVTDIRATDSVVHDSCRVATRSRRSRP